MSDLIDRQKAYEVLTDYYHHSTDVQHEALREALNRVPSAEPELKTGKWIELPWCNEKCSVCGAYFPVAEFLSRPFEINYCPSCGADMRGEG